MYYHHNMMFDCAIRAPSKQYSGMHYSHAVSYLGNVMYLSVPQMRKYHLQTSDHLLP